MKQTVNSYDFHRAFETLRPNNFSYDGLNALFEMMEEYEESCDAEVELDVIAICCDYTESSVDEIIQDYIYQYRKIFIPVSGNNTLVADKKVIFNADITEELKDCEDDDEKADVIEDWLNENTFSMRLDDGSFVYQAF